MKYQALEKELYISNRQNFSKKLKPNSLSVFHSSDEFPRSADQLFPFKQNPDFFYLCGIDQEQCILLIFPDCPNPVYREVLFLRQTNEHIAIWEGRKYDKQRAEETSGIQNIFWMEDFWSIFPMLMHMAEYVYLNTNEHDKSSREVFYKDLRFIQEVQAKFPLHKYERSAPIMQELRMVKSIWEIAAIKKACSITRDAFIRVLNFTKPGVGEYEIEAEIIHEFIRQRASGHAYAPIVASGKNACILHYVDNDSTCQDGDILLLDFGAEYANYNADLSRSIPVNGRFSKRQKDVYNAVLRIMAAAKDMIRPSVLLDDYQKELGKIVTSELLQLGLLDKHAVAKQNPKFPAYKKYLMHGISHHLGLDVHDISNRYTPFSPGNILTCEPGIYIPEENLGIRLENDLLVTEDGNIDLMGDIPLEAEDIEALMNA